MKDRNLEFVTRLGSKSQIVLRKDIRDALGLRPGSLVKLSKSNQHLEIRAMSKEDLINQVESIAKMIGRKWPKGKTSVDLVREERR